MVRICIADSSTSDAEIICNLLERELDAKRISNSIDIVLSRNEIDKLAEAYYLRSLVFTELGQDEKAASDKEKAVILKPDIVELLESK